MCLLNFSPYDDDDPDYPLPSARPRLAWVIPIDMRELGASLQAIADTMPHTTILRLSHRFRNSLLSKLPQELLEEVISHVQHAKRTEKRPEWYQDSICWQSTCQFEDHFSIYNEDVERIWQKICRDKEMTGIYGHNPKSVTEAKKIEEVQSWMDLDPEKFDNEGGWSLHFDARLRWLDRTCTCPESHSTITTKVGQFTALRNLLKSHFNLDAIILHEVLSSEMYAFLPNTSEPRENAYYTRCYLALPESHLTQGSDSRNEPAPHQLFQETINHTAFREIVDASVLSISEEQRSRFTWAMKQLEVKPWYHLSELEAHIIHPIKDEDLACFCSCRDMDCPGACYDIHSWDRPHCLEETLNMKSKELAKESWPKLMNLAASDAVTPYGWGEVE